MVTILGVDDAGRGPVIGPLVMGGVLIDKDKEELLRDIGAKDSKMLTSFQREDLYEGIIKIAKSFKVILYSPQQVDDAVARHNLNWLEADATIQMINEFKPDIAFLDCPSNNIKAYSSYIEKKVMKEVAIQAEHKADALYPVVSAASIIAKVTRDREIEKLKKEFGVDFGSGYPSDPRTVLFLEKNYREKKYQEIIRKSWASVKDLEERRNQKKLGEF